MPNLAGTTKEYISRSGGSREGTVLFLDQNEARRAEKKFLETGPLPYLRV